MIRNPTLGTDAEIFLKDLTGRYFPACGLIGGTKEKPKDLGDGYAVQEDNVMLEFNTRVAKSREEWALFVQEGLKRAIKTIPPSLVPAIDPSAEFELLFLDGIPQANVFGCEPDFNAWTRETNPKPTCDNRKLRTAAAHVHIGWDDPTMQDRENLIRAADIFVSLPSVWEDTDKKRRLLYGKAGAFRLKPYGVEHRVASNYWLRDAALIDRVYLRYMKAIKFVNEGGVIAEEDARDIQIAINKCDVALAEKLAKKYKATN